MIHKQLTNINKTIGFAVTNGKAGEGGFALTRSFVSSDIIVFCFKAGWRFGLFFDFTYSQFQKDYVVDGDVLQKDLGKHYRQLLFDYLYKLVENTATFTELKKDGWFPYVEIINNEYKTLT